MSLHIFFLVVSTHIVFSAASKGRMDLEVLVYFFVKLVKLQASRRTLIVNNNCFFIAKHLCLFLSCRQVFSILVIVF